MASVIRKCWKIVFAMHLIRNTKGILPNIKAYKVYNSHIFALIKDDNKGIISESYHRYMYHIKMLFSDIRIM